jgi:hypothetical protein
MQAVASLRTFRSAVADFAFSQMISEVDALTTPFVAILVHFHFAAAASIRIAIGYSRICTRVVIDRTLFRASVYFCVLMVANLQWFMVNTRKKRTPERHACRLYIIQWGYCSVALLDSSADSIPKVAK